MPITENILKKHVSDNLVETGSYLGLGIQNAIVSGFKKIYSIELSKKYYNICINKFKYYENVKLFLGDSSEILGDVITKIDSKITFWLDGHFSGSDTAKGIYEFPILQELDHINKHKLKDHIILIDDVRCFNSDNNINLSMIIDKIRIINNNYIIEFKDGPKFKNDILIARV